MKQEMETTPSIPVKDEVLNITKGNWEYTIDWRDGTLNIQSEKGAYIATIKDAEANSSHQDAKAICRAVNNTYGKGLNPESCLPMFNALSAILDGINTKNKDLNIGSIKVLCETILQNAKTTKP